MVKVGSARCTEAGKAINGLAGDQTGREVAEEPFYMHKKGLYILRAKDAKVAVGLANNMKDACNNNCIGYDQNQRLSLFEEAKKVKFNLRNVKVKCETDCSALVRVCCYAVGIVVANFNTASEVTALLATGQFTKLDCNSEDDVCLGDILVTKTKGHTLIVTECTRVADTMNPAITPSDKPAISVIAKEVIAGKWGNGAARRKNLEAAGYNYKEVQAEVNKQLKLKK